MVYIYIYILKLIKLGLGSVNAQSQGYRESSYIGRLKGLFVDELYWLYLFVSYLGMFGGHRGIV